MYIAHFQNSDHVVISKYESHVYPVAKSVMSMRVKRETYDEEFSILEICGNGPANFSEFIYILKPQQ